MTSPDGIFEDQLTGSTPPHLVELALSGHLAAAAGGENHVPRDEAIAVMDAVIYGNESPEVAIREVEAQAEEPVVAPVSTPAPAPVADSKPSKDATAS